MKSRTSLGRDPFGVRRLSAIGLAILVGMGASAPVEAAFGLTSAGGQYIVDTGAGLVFQVDQSNGDITSIVFNGVEYQSPTKRSHIGSGLGSATTVTGTTISNECIKITIQTDPGNTVASSLTHYLMVRNGVNNIYMATYPTAEPSVGELRWITRLQSDKLPNGPEPSDNRGNSGAIESSDVFGFPDGTTSSKYYGDTVTHGKDRAMDLTFCGAASTGVGVWMVYDNPRESASGGPFFRDIQNQCGTDQEIYNYMNSGHNQTEANRLNVLHGPYTLVFTSGEEPILPIDYSWIETYGLDLTGWVSAADRGAVEGVATGIPGGFQGVVGFANTSAQYWAEVDAQGHYTTPLMKPGTYDVTLYKGELEVATTSVAVSAGLTNMLDLASTETAPTSIFRIGEWDGTPSGFQNADKIVRMHPQDIRMDPWGPVTFNVGTDSLSNFPMACWKDANNPTTVHFNLTANQIMNLTLRIGITCAYSGGRPKPNIGSWNPSNPSPSSQPNSRSLTLGTYRGNNTLYTYTVPASALVVGQNTLTLTVISGSGSLGPFLSPGCGYDAVELSIPGTSPLPPPAPIALVAGYLDADEVQLSWSDTSTNEVNFLIERSPDNVTFTLIGAVTQDVTTYTDSNVGPDAWYYRVRSGNAGGESAPSIVAHLAPPAISAVQSSGNQLVLAGSGGAAGGTFTVLASTDFTLPPAQWTPDLTNQFDANGHFQLTNVVDPAAAQLYYQVRIP